MSTFWNVKNTCVIICTNQSFGDRRFINTTYMKLEYVDFFPNNATLKPWIGCHVGVGRERENILIYQTPEILTYVLGTSWFRMHTYILVWCCLIYRSRPVWHSGYHLFVRAVEIQFVHVVDSHRIWKYICFLTGNMR